MVHHDIFCRTRRLRGGGAGRVVQLEPRNKFAKIACLGVQRMAACGGLFNHGGVLLCHLVQLRDPDIDLGQPCRLFRSTRRDFRYKARNMADMFRDARQDFAGLANQADAIGDLIRTAGDQRLDLLGRLRGALRQRAHF